MSTNPAEDAFRALKEAIKRMGEVRATINTIHSQLRNANGQDRADLIRQQKDSEDEWEKLYQNYRHFQIEYQRLASKPR
jgi:hypothetical protein